MVKKLSARPMAQISGLCTSIPFIFVNFVITDFTFTFRDLGGQRNTKRIQPDVKTEDDTTGEQYVIYNRLPLFF